MKWLIEGYISVKHAVRAAEVRGEGGVTGSGQEAKAICMTGYPQAKGWLFQTWDGRYLCPGGEVAFSVVLKVMGIEIEGEEK